MEYGRSERYRSLSKRILHRFSPRIELLRANPWERVMKGGKRSYHVIMESRYCG